MRPPEICNAKPGGIACTVEAEPDNVYCADHAKLYRLGACSFVEYMGKRSFAVCRAPATSRIRISRGPMEYCAHHARQIIAKIAVQGSRDRRRKVRK